MKRQITFALLHAAACSVAFVEVAGADGKHWAYIPPVRPSLPEVAKADWPRNPIDAFVLAKLEERGLEPAPEAGGARLIRRLYLDLAGVPPPVEEVDAFLADTGANAYEAVVDRLLASPRYGEHWARHWLDLARYADSNGYQRDGHRSAWPYRDWVIRAINDDMPFDRFTIEQLAGDLLPGATIDQRIATGFHRSTTVNVEAGVDREEDRVNAVIDRVNTTGTVWLGTTIACAQCHSHKYDPISQEEYYRLFAYFNNTEIETSGGEGSVRQFTGPRMQVPEPESRRAERRRIEELLARRKIELEERTAVAKEAQGDWERSLVERPEELNSLPADIRDALALSGPTRTNDQRSKLTRFYLERHGVVEEERRRVAELEERVTELAAPTTLAMVELPAPRETRVFRRGSFLQPGAAVEAGVPGVFHALAPDAPPNRLTLARWLCDPSNPLVGRVTVNRWWAELFGRGLVATLEDFGTQGEAPTHPELLDWLATELIEQGWSMKAIHRLIVTSATYRQSSKRSDPSERDPEAKWYSRGPRFRMEAERIRDNALAIGGLLHGKMGGPPVRPPQPEGIWTVTGVVDNTYRTSEGADRYRRGIYTVWRRSSPYPSFVAFDAPDRASTCVKRPRTNTPLQALALMNDPVYVEAAFALAARIARAPIEERAALARGKRAGSETSRTPPAPAEIESSRSSDAGGPGGPPALPGELPAPARGTAPLRSRSRSSDAGGPPALPGAALLAAARPDEETRARAAYGFRLCVSRHPTPEETDELELIYRRERERFEREPRALEKLLEGWLELNEAAPAEGVDRRDLGAWFYVATILLNLDETLTKG